LRFELNLLIKQKKEYFMKQKTITITQKVNLPASPDDVYCAFVDPKKHSEFTDSEATGKAEVGAKFTAWDGYIQGKHLELEQGKRILQEWVTTDWPEGYSPSQVEFSFKANKGGTEVTMVHSNVPAEQDAELAQGWIDFYWEPLKDYFKKQKPSTKTKKFTL
jgi:activator of HSP90 ATPase